MWLVTVGVFAIFFVGPGAQTVARRLAGKNATPQIVAEVTHRLQLDRPIYVQYWHFLWLLLHGNLGYSYYHGQSVNSVLKAGVPDHAVAGHRGGHHLARARRAVRRAVRGAVAVRRGPGRHRAGPVLLLDADVRARPAAAAGLLLRAHHPRHPRRSRPRLHPVQPEPAGWFRVADPAVDHARAGVGGDLHPADPRLDARRAGRGLHPHRPGQGAVRAAGHLPARAAGGADPDRHPVRHRRRHPARRRGHHRGRVRACPASATPRCSPSSSRTCR